MLGKPFSKGPRRHVSTTTTRGHGRSLYVAAPSTFLRRDECDRPDKHRRSGSDTRSGQGDGSPTVFSKEGDASPAAASLLLLLTKDVETNPGPSCYACGQNFRQSDTPLNCHAQDPGVRSHKQTRCSGVPRSQQSLTWYFPTNGGPGPPATTQTSHACYSCQHPFRPGTRSLACHALGNIFGTRRT